MAQRYVAIVPPRKAAGKFPALNGEGVIIEGGEKPLRYKLENMDDVRLLARGIFVSKWRKPEGAEDVSGIIPLHRKYRDRKKEEPEESFSGLHDSQMVKKEKRYTYVAIVSVVSEVASVSAGVSSWRKPDPTENVSGPPSNVRFRKRREEELEGSFSNHHPSQLVKKKKRLIGLTTVKVVSEVAVEFAGVQSGDIVASFLGSTGARVLAGLIHRIKEGISVRGITVFGFMAIAPECPDEERAFVMAKALVEKSALPDSPFYPMFESSLPQIKMGALYDIFVDIQWDRIKQGNRVHAAMSNKTFDDSSLFFSNESIETLAEAEMEKDVVHVGLLKEEERIKKELAKLLGQIPIYVRLRERVKGAAVSILAPIIASTIAIRRFPKMGAARKFWGTGLNEGKFMKMTTGTTLGYHPGCRQAMFQFGQRIVKGNAEEYWCERYVANVAMYKARHLNSVLVELVKSMVAGEEKKWVESGRKFNLVPGTFTEEKVKGKKKWIFTLENGQTTVVEKGYFLYNPGHLFRMALWRTLTEWSDWLYWFWWSFEGLDSRPPKFYPPEDHEAVEKTATKWFAKHPAKVPKGYKPPPPASVPLIQGMPVANAA